MKIQLDPAVKRALGFAVYNSPRQRFIPSPLHTWGFLLVICIVSSGGHLEAAPASPTPQAPEADVSSLFRDTQRVTAVDVLATYQRPDFRQWATGSELPSNLSPEDFVLTVDGQTVEVVAVAPPTEGRWRFVLYFDAVLTSPETTIWAATLFGQHLETLLAYGDVEVVLADPSPRYLLHSSDDGDEVSRVLAQLALQPTAGAQLQRLRDEFLSLVAEQPADAEMIDLLVAEEKRQVGRRHDQLITWLVDANDGERPSSTNPTDRRAVFYVSDGFDAQPEAFYGNFLETSDLETSGETDSAPLPTSDDPTTHLAFTTGQILASYGWVALPMLPPEPELVTRGLRLGKFLIKPLGPHMMNEEPKESARADQHGLRGLIERLSQLFLVGAHMTYEEHRDKDKAEAYLELATALHGQDKLEDAAEAYNKALFHFSGDPRTADRQAFAMAGVGDMLAQLGENLGAQRAYQKALTLDPDMANDVGTGIAFVDPIGGFEPWTDATVGAMIRRGNDLEQFFNEGAAKVRLTYQLATMPTGQIQDIVVRTPSLPGSWTHPSWTRSGTPQTVTEAYLRQVLDATLQLNPVVDGDITRRGGAPAPTVQAHIDTRGHLQLTVRRPRPTPEMALAEDVEPTPAHLRLSMASASADVPTVIVHRPLTLAGPEVTIAPGEALDHDAQALAVIIEDLATGSWQVRLLQ